MTRINAGVDPSELSRQHLLAEHREIKRIPNAVSSGKVNLNDLPLEFSLGKGHVRFFYNKLEYLRQRYALIRDECYKRGYNVTDYEDAWDNIPATLMNGWEPSQDHKIMIQQRISERSASRL